MNRLIILASLLVLSLPQAFAADMQAIGRFAVERTEVTVG